MEEYERRELDYKKEWNFSRLMIFPRKASFLFKSQFKIAEQPFSLENITIDKQELRL